MPEKALAASDGFIVTLPVRFARDPDGIVHMELVGLETVRRTNALAP